MNNSYFKGKYHWKNKEKLNNDSIYLRNLYKKNLLILSKKLNQFHNQNFSQRYWKILVGPWLKFFIDVVFDRYENERINNLNYKIKYRSKNPKVFYREIDFNEFYSISNTDEWNDNLIKLINGKDPIFIESKKTKKLSLKNNFTLFFLNFLRKILNKNILISDIYISKSETFKLLIKKGLLPLFPPQIRLLKDNNWAHFLGEYKYTKIKNNINFETLIEKLIEVYIPLIYTDGFNNFRKSTLNYVGEIPRTVFTCIGYQHNEIFKLIAAETIRKGGKLIIGQHGGTFGLSKHNQMEEHQIEISDKFLSWGWNHKELKNIKPFISLQLSSSKILKPNTNKKIINVMASTPRYFYALFSLALGPEYLDYLYKQKILSENLNNDISKNVYHRLNGDQFGWGAAQKLKNLNLNICPYQESLTKTLSKYSLCISSYNATVALQTLSSNYPTLIYWPKDIFEIRNEAAKDIRNLSLVGIFHDNEDSISNILNKIYDDIPSWWRNKELQKARLKFCQKYANKNQNWMDFLMREINY